MSERKIYQHSLSNGLKLIAEVNPHSKSASLGFFVRTGARDETVKESGISHFLEHMMFKGTDKRDALQISYELGDIGAQANAYTSDETTVYYSAIVPDYFARLQDLLSDMLRPSLDPKEFDMEKKVILEEIALYQDRPFMFLYDKALRDYFGQHPSGNSVLGTTESVGAISQPEMKAYFDRRYAPNNMVLVATGLVDWDSFVNSAEKLCGSWKKLETPRALKRYPGKDSKQIYRKKNLKQGQVLFFTEGPAAQDPDRFSAAVLSVIIGDSSGSKLYWELVDTGIAESASFDSDEKDGAGLFSAHASAEFEHLELVADKMRAIFSKSLDFTKEDLDRAKTKLLTRTMLSGESPMGRLMALGNSWIYNAESPTIEEIGRRISAVNRESIEQLIARYPIKDWGEYRLLAE